jgi:hypothetical protein
MMKMVKQKLTTDGTIAMDCGVCVIAMLTDLSYEKILADVPQYENTTDFAWMCYVNLLGFQVDQVDENDPPLGRRLFCGIKAILNGKLVCHAIAVDESGHIFDPANGAPNPGTLTLQQCLAHGTFEIQSCFAISERMEAEASINNT